jgi:hypothetical protein
MLDLRTQAEAAEALRLSERTLERMRLPGLIALTDRAASLKQIARRRDLGFRS